MRAGRLLAAVLLAALGPPLPAAAALLRVAPGDPACTDEGEGGAPFCTLRGAVVAANGDPGEDRIELAPGSLHQLAAVDHRSEGGNGLPAVTGRLTVEGQGAVIERSPSPGTPTFRLLRVAPEGDLTLRGLILRRGATEAGFDGAAIWNLGRLTLEGCVLEENDSADDGGAVRNDGELLAVGSVFRGNEARGRGGTGGALYNVGIGGVGRARLEGSTLVDNQAGSSGGAVWNEGELVAVNSTLSDNRAIWGGGGLHNNGAARLHHATVAGNRAGVLGGGVRAQGPVELIHSLLAGNDSPIGPDCEGQVLATGGNWIENPVDCLLAGDGFGQGSGVGLGPLGEHGGPTPTHPLAAASPALDAAPPWPGGCPATDQRGAPRPRGAAGGEAACDLGAYEAP